MQFIAISHLKYWIFFHFSRSRLKIPPSNSAVSVPPSTILLQPFSFRFPRNQLLQHFRVERVSHGKGDFLNWNRFSVYESKITQLRYWMKYKKREIMIGRSVVMVTLLSVIGLFDQFVRSWKDFFSPQPQSVRPIYLYNEGICSVQLTIVWWWIKLSRAQDKLLWDFQNQFHFFPEE